MKILLIEDDKSVARAVFRLLRTRGHDVTHVDTVNGARDYLDVTHVDCILTDRDLPDGDGWEFAVVRNERVVFMSGTAPADTARFPLFHLKGTDTNILIALVEGMGENDA